MDNLYIRQNSLDLNTNQSITVVGCGGIGYWVAKFAAMSGIEKLYLFDPDAFEEHNLNRIDLPIKFIGVNKAQATKAFICSIRPSATVLAFPFILQDHTFPKSDWVVDCTDKFCSQKENEKIAQQYGSRYVKAGYNGEDMSIHNAVADWGEAQDGYTIIPSWVVPAAVVAALTVAKILKYQDKEMASNIKNLLVWGKR
ncbi:MAG TPA: ThiF family adenylyltransferase [Bacteroidales bacterium]|nr:ThiF family adenylyltransferase [Bacteroidales bacterium]